MADHDDLVDYLSDGDFNPDDVYSPEASEDVDCVLIVDGFPSTSKEKLSKLIGVAGKQLFSVVGRLALPSDFDRAGKSPEELKAASIEYAIYMPVSDETGKTEGFAFVEYHSKEEATKAAKKIHNAKFGKKVLSVYRVNQVQRLLSVDDEFKTPDDVKPFESRASDLDVHMMDDRGRDQFMVRYDGETDVNWAESRGAPSNAYCGERHKVGGRTWTERKAEWSPQGSYLLTYHPRGVLIWGGPEFTERARVGHAEVHQVAFSPCERYLATWNGGYGARNPEALVLTDVVTCAQLLKLPQYGPDEVPDFAWSADGNYFVRLGSTKARGSKPSTVLMIYAAPEFKVLDGKYTAAPGAQQMTIAPAGRNVVGWWSPAGEDTPASVMLIELPSRKLVSQRSLFNVVQILFHWHPSGDFLAVQAVCLTRAQMRKKRQLDQRNAPLSELMAELKQPPITKFEIFVLREKTVPVANLELKETVTDFAWQPNGNAFSIIHGNGPRQDVTFYTLPPRGATLAEVHTVTGVDANRAFWSPLGTHILLAGLDNLGGKLEFYDYEEQRSLAQVEHPQCTGITWDPSGRIVSTVKTQPFGGDVSMRFKVDNTYKLWTFQGRYIYEAPTTTMKALFSFQWRPRPVSLLTDDEVKEVHKNLKTYVKRYASEDKIHLLERRRIRNDFRAILESRRKAWESPEEVEARREVGVPEPDEGVRYIEEVSERVVSRVVSDES